MLHSLLIELINFSHSDHTQNTYEKVEVNKTAQDICDVLTSESTPEPDEAQNWVNKLRQHNASSEITDSSESSDTLRYYWAKLYCKAEQKRKEQYLTTEKHLQWQEFKSVTLQHTFKSSEWKQILQMRIFIRPIVDWLC